MSFTSEEDQGPNWILEPSKVSDALAAKSGVCYISCYGSKIGSTSKMFRKFPTSIAMVSDPAARVWQYTKEIISNGENVSKTFLR